jgi:N-acetylmuramoyl-L-alanine amidase
MIAICVGHSRKISGRYDGGAYSAPLNINERDFNLKVASQLSKKLASRNIRSKIIDHYNGNGYGSAMADVARQVKEAGATLAIELHFNSATPQANGHEWLYWHSSEIGQKIAGKFEKEFSKEFPGIKSRGLKSITKKDRGGKFLELTHCPAIILEPFFGSSVGDCARINVDGLTEAFSRVLGQCMNQ